MSTPGTGWKVYAIRYATRAARRGDHFIGGDPHDGPLAMDYFVWVIVGATRSVVVDAGFTAETASARGREYLCDPIDALERLGVSAGTVGDVILTHLHYDHAGHFDRFPVARFHLQEAEMHHAVGRHMRNTIMSHPYNVDDVVGLVRMNYDQRVRMLTGAGEVAPGIRVTPAPGHSPGLQFVTVDTAHGVMVLASDVAHYYEHLHSRRVYPVVVDLAAALDAYDAVEAAAGARGLIVPGHDPEVMRRFPIAAPGLEGVAVRLDLGPA